MLVAPFLAMLAEHVNTCYMSVFVISRLTVSVYYPLTVSDEFNSWDVTPILDVSRKSSTCVEFSTGYIKIYNNKIFE